jgi:hypothetical protein
LAVDLAAAVPGAGVRDLVVELEERAAAQHAPTVDGVTLASLHAAKGLEWDAVFLVGLVDGTLPLVHADTPAAVEEERRLLYVGVTRAREHLALSWALARSPGGRASRSPSRFLDGLGLARGGRVRPRGGRPPRRARRARSVGPVACRVCGAALMAAVDRKLGRCADCPADRDEQLFEALRSWRADTAKALGQPAYCVLTDATLGAIAEQRSQRASVSTQYAGLAELRGVGAPAAQRLEQLLVAVGRGSRRSAELAVDRRHQRRARRPAGHRPDALARGARRGGRPRRRTRHVARRQPVEEARRRPAGPAPRRAGEGPGQRQVLAGAGDADVEQPALLLDAPGCRRAPAAACRRPATRKTASHSSPWRRAARQRDAVDGGRVLRGGALLQLDDEVAHAGPGHRGREVDRQPVTAASDSHRSRVAPAPAAGRRATTTGRPAGLPRHAPGPAGRRVGSPAGARSKQQRLAHLLPARRSAHAPRHQVGTPASDSAASYSADCALIRYSTASRSPACVGAPAGGTWRATRPPRRARRRARRTRCCRAGRALGDQLELRGCRMRGRALTPLASATTSGVER